MNLYILPQRENINSASINQRKLPNIPTIGGGLRRRWGLDWIGRFVAAQEVRVWNSIPGKLAVLGCLCHCYDHIAFFNQVAELGV